MSRGRQHKQYLARAHAMGGSTTVPAGATVKVLADLAERMSYTAIARELGTSHNYVTRVIRGEIKRMQPSRYAAIMALGDFRPTGTVHVDARATARRLQALHALGYSWERLEREIGSYSLGAIKQVVYGRTPVVEAQHAEVVAETFERLSMRLPEPANRNEASGVTRARNTARRNGWPPPLAWDDIERDDRPAGGHDRSVDEVVVQRILDGDFTLAKNATKAEREAVVEAWTGSLAQLARQTGWKVERYRKDGAA